jgi:predicted TPR repeat methyltransferase
MSQISQDCLIIVAAWQPISSSLASINTTRKSATNQLRNERLIIASIAGEEHEFKSITDSINELLPSTVIANATTDKEEVALILSQYSVIQLPCLIFIDTSDKIVKKEFPKREASTDSTDNEIEYKARSAFSNAVESYDRFDFPAAAEGFHRALDIDPSYKSALFNLAGLLHMVGYPTLAVNYIQELLLLDPEDMTSHSFLWALTQSPEASRAGIDAYRRLADAGDIKASAKLAALTGEGALAAKGDPTYAERIYDDMAEKFETKLVSHLGYRGPWDMEEMVASLLEESSCCAAAPPRMMPDTGSWRILDLGCGSGLVGRVFSTFAGKGCPGKVGESDAEGRLHYCLW